MVFGKRRADVQSIERTAEHEFTGLLGNVGAGPGESVDIEVLSDLFPLGQDGGVGLGVLPHDVQLDLRPIADLIVLHLAHGRRALSGIRS
jgi:hypothetical protein